DFTREDIHSAEREDAEAGALKTFWCVDDAVEDFVERAVAAGGDDNFESFFDCLGREPAWVAHGGGLLEGGFRGELVQVMPEMARFVPFGGWVEDDTGAHRE